jgi:hypothetical protein
MIIRFLFIGMLMFTLTLTFGQTNISGTWTLQSKQHVLGPEYLNALAKQITLHQTADSLIIEMIGIDGNGQEVSSRQSVAMNGQQVTGISATNRNYVKSLKWAPGKKDLVVTTVFYMPGNSAEVDFTRVETFSLSPDGKRLNIHKKSVETRSETWEVKGVYDKK